jgi:hypothetical protein
MEPVALQTMLSAYIAGRPGISHELAVSYLEAGNICSY